MAFLLLYAVNLCVGISVLGVESKLCFAALFEELLCNLFKECIRKNVFVLLNVISSLFLKIFKLGSNIVCGTAGDRLFVSDDLLSELGIDLHRSLTVFTLDKSLEFLGYRLVTSVDYVEHSLCTNDLRGGCYERRITRVCTNSRYFFKNLCQLVALAEVLKLRNKVGAELNGYLRFDFAVLNENNEVIRLIEFDGMQHINMNNYFNDFALPERDERKNQYAKEKGIPLIRIPYYKRDTLTLEDLFGDQFII